MSAHILGPPIGGITGLLTAVNPGPPAPTPPGTPSLWYDAQNIDGLNNSSLVDGQVIGTWSNRGSLGSSGNVVQATAGLKPTYKQVASSGKLNNKSCVRSDGARSMQSGALTTLTQPTLIAAVALTTSVAAGIRWIIDGRTTQRDAMGQNGSPVEIFAGTFIQPGQNWSANTYQNVDCTFNGASSVCDMDGTASSSFNPGAGGLDGVTLFSDLAAGSLWIGDIVEVLVYNGGGQPTAAAVRAYFTAKYGATPQ